MASMCIRDVCVHPELIWTYFTNGYATLEIGMLVAMFAVRLGTSLLFAGVLSNLLGKGACADGRSEGIPVGAKLRIRIL